MTKMQTNTCANLHALNQRLLLQILWQTKRLQQGCYRKIRLKVCNSSPCIHAFSDHYFMAKDGQSCDDACSDKNLHCDLPKLEAAAKDEETCKGIIEGLGYTLDKGDAYPDECDYGGCTFNGDEENGENWYFLMKPGGTELPTCDGKPQFSRNRVCACTANAPGTRPITDRSLHLP